MGSSSSPAAEEKKGAVTYWAKEKALCPNCQKEFPQEVMHKGGGRMIAGPLTDELHRVFEPSKKYGSIYPLLYEVGCCPRCHMALFWRDFTDIRDSGSLARIQADDANRKHTVETVFPYYNLKQSRTLYDGAAMYYLALLCYEKVDVAYAPTFKRAVITLRLAWLCGDLERACPGRNFGYIGQSFYRKALFFYQQTLQNEMGRVESVEVISNFGPDIDKNYGYDGVKYLSALLEYKYGQTEDVSLRLKKLDEAKRTIARIFGLGKSSKEKPGPLLEHAKNLYDKISKELADSNIFDVEEG